MSTVFINAYILRYEEAIRKLARIRPTKSTFVAERCRRETQKKGAKYKFSLGERAHCRLDRDCGGGDASPLMLSEDAVQSVD